MKKHEKPFGMVIGKMMREMGKVLKQRSAEQTETKLTIEQFILLHAINVHEEEVNQQDMAALMGKDKSSILRIIDSLEEKELVRRVVDQKDRRKNYLMTTKKAEKVLVQYLEIELNLERELTEGLTEEEIQIFYKVVNHIKSKAEEL